MSTSPAADAADPERIAQLLARLEAVLEEEYAALCARDVDRLEQTVKHKTALLEALEEITKISPERPPGWAVIKPRFERCARANRINGGAIEVNRMFVTDLLDLLRGNSPEQRTYDGHGQLTDSGTSGTLTQV